MATSSCEKNKDLCQLCRNIFIGPVAVHAQAETNQKECERPHHKTLDSLTAAADAGCFICKCLVRGVLTRPGVQDGSKDISMTYLVWDDWEFEQEIWFKYGGYKNIVFQLFSTIDVNVLPSQSISSKSTGSDSCVSQINTWLHGCQHGHSLCNNTLAASGWKPTRLLKVERDGKGVQLCQGADIPATKQYASLSHRWGTNKSSA